MLHRLGRILQSLKDPYRPERYYMRGPGPKTAMRRQSEADRFGAAEAGGERPGAADIKRGE